MSTNPHAVYDADCMCFLDLSQDKNWTGSSVVEIFDLHMALTFWIIVVTMKLTGTGIEGLVCRWRCNPGNYTLWTI